MAFARRARVFWIGAVAAIVAAAVLVVFLTSGPGPVARTEPPPAPPLSTADANRLGAEVASGDAAELADALFVPDGQALDPAGVAALAQLHLRVDATTFHRDPYAGDAGTVSAGVTGPDGVTKTWTLTVVYTGSAWRIASSTLED